jgi:hypothetical protein
MATLPPEAEAPEDRELLEQWFVEHHYKLRDVSAKIAPVVFLSAAFDMWFLAPPSVRPIFIGYFLLLTAASVFWTASRHRRPAKPSLRPIALSLLTMQVINIGGLALIMWVGGADPQITRSEIMIGWVIYVVAGIFICDANKFLYGIGLAGAIAHVLLGVLFWHLQGLEHLLSWALVLSGCDFYVLYYNYRRLRDSWELARNTLKTRRLEKQNEHLRLLAMESELQLARQIQESLAPPPAALTVGDLSVKFFHVPFDVLGGDWLAARPLDDGRWVIVVGDVTGKGIPAAMVLQAVQCLWAQSLNDTKFDPGAWILALNRTLVTMGRREPHTMTLGLLVLGPEEIVYYSAGHVPLVLIHDPDAPTHIEAVCGHGNIIGLSVDATIEPIVVPIPKGKPFALMLGSDGVLDFNTRLHRRNIVQLMAEVTAEGREAIVRHAVADDKILVVVEKAAGGAPSKLSSAGREPKPGHSQIEKHGRLKAHS